MMVTGFRFFYFLLALIISALLYSALLFGIYLFFLKPKPKPRVIVVRAVIVSKEKKTALVNNPGKKKLIQQPKPKSTPKPKKTPPKGKKGTKTATTKGGEKLDFSDIFKGVNYKIPTTKVRQKAQLEKSRFKGNNKLAQIRKELQKSFNALKVPSYQPQPNSGSTLTSKEANEIYDKMRRVWEEVYTLPNQYIILDVTYRSGRLYVSVVRGNLPPAVQKELIHKLKQLIFTKDFSLRVRFIAKHK